jgi:Tfp pilus assembly PilM family ATPase
MLKDSAPRQNIRLKLSGSISRKDDEISSTERLLELIRRQGAAAVELPEPVSWPQTQETRMPRLSKMWRSKKTSLVSVDSVEKAPDLEQESTAAAVEHPEPVSSPQTPKRRKLHLAKILPLKKTITVGVDIREKELKLAKVKQPSDQRCELLDFKSVPLEPNIPKDSPEFSEFLQVALSDFCGTSEKCELWAVMSSAFLEMRDIRIPSKVPKDQILNAVYWTFKKEVLFNEEESILNFEVLGDVVEQGINKTAVRVYTAPREEVAQLKDLFAKSGYALTGISVAPFAIQNLLRAQWIQADQKAVASLYVGTERSQIDIYNSRNVVFTRGIKTGMNSLIEGILEGLKRAQEENEFKLTEEGASHPTMRD